jgi:hypothetical protein
VFFHLFVQTNVLNFRVSRHLLCSHDYFVLRFAEVIFSLLSCLRVTVVCTWGSLPVYYSTKHIRRKPFYHISVVVVYFITLQII